tara:strand:+ start:754 stop:1869 length:1116 start_codon:yes stop_codon:yes gene_type:complete
MKKLIFRKFAVDTLSFFLIMCLTIGLIVWTLQAVNYFDYVTQDGHGLKTYFFYTFLNFPKIIHRIIPFMFFISLFYMIVNYENRNELLIFWTSGVSKIDFVNKVLFFSIFLTIFQILIGGFFSPFSQYKGREILKNSNIDFFTSLIKEGKFLNVVDGLTIFINTKNQDGSYSNIFIDDSSKVVSRMIYAKSGNLYDNDNTKIFKLFEGEVINKNETKINVFKFDQIDFNLNEYSTSTILVPKIQELKSKDLFVCLQDLYNNKSVENEFDFRCEKSLQDEIYQEMFKRFYKPLYIPVIALLCCYLIIFSKNNIRYEKNKKIIFFMTFITIVVSEATLRYSSVSIASSIIYLIVPWMLFVIVYLFLNKKIKNV